VLDFCAGSFTTGIACLREGRDFIGIEKEERYYLRGVARMKEEAAQLAVPIARVPNKPEGDGE